MNTERFNRQLDFLIEIDKVKHILRNTILMDASRKENDAEHSWHLALAALVLQEYLDEQNIDLTKVLQMVLIHDLVEIDAGDAFAYGNIDWEQQSQQEKLAAERIFGLLPLGQKQEFFDLWSEFEAAQTGEARYAKALDSFLPILHNYRTQGLQWQRLGVTREQVLNRNRRIEKASKQLWAYIVDLVDEAVAKGYLHP
ncbi:MAG TPA: HD domain-containing protein [Bacillota bacterium]|nr:HD domain-containing protein [Bacillota bacterium]